MSSEDDFASGFPGGVVEIASWFPLLGWSKLPNFGAAHAVEMSEDFEKNYYLSSELTKFKTNIFLTLTGRFEQQNIRLMGRPGCGKTSFLYSLIKESEEAQQGSVLSDAFFYMFHANRINSTDEDEVEDIVIGYIIDAWKKLFTAAGEADVSERIDDQNVSDKRKLNAFTEYYRNHRSQFPKVMIFLIDDADLVKDREVQNVVRAVLRNLNLTFVKKWLVIRECTYQGYSARTRELIDGFFPDRRAFPHISLHEIISHRIKNGAGNEKAKNPFSEELCYMVLERLFDGNLREALAILQNILSYVSPGKFAKTTDESVIQQYINTTSINALIGLGHLPNLYDDRYRCGHLPLVIDVLVSNRHTKAIEHLYAATNTAVAHRVDRAHLLNGDKFIKVRETDFAWCVDMLVDLGLAERRGKLVAQTPKGFLMSDYVARSHYQELCEGLLKKQFAMDPTFWKLAIIPVDHEKIVLDLVTWDLSQRSRG